MNDIEIALEDLDTLVEIARQHTGIASWLGLVQSALIMKEALEKQLNGGWIPVSERLPEIDDYYLTTWQGYHSIEPVTRFNRFSCGRFEVDGIKAWQPLPEPYKEVEND